MKTYVSLFLAILAIPVVQAPFPAQEANQASQTRQELMKTVKAMQSAIGKEQEEKTVLERFLKECPASFEEIAKDIRIHKLRL